jgi:hypothetical protein
VPALCVQVQESQPAHASPSKETPPEEPPPEEADSLGLDNWDFDDASLEQMETDALSQISAGVGRGSAATGSPVASTLPGGVDAPIVAAAAAAAADSGVEPAGERNGCQWRAVPAICLSLWTLTTRHSQPCLAGSVAGAPALDAASSVDGAHSQAGVPALPPGQARLQEQPTAAAQPLLQQGQEEEEEEAEAEEEEEGDKGGLTAPMGAENHATGDRRVKSQSRSPSPTFGDSDRCASMRHGV